MEKYLLSVRFEMPKTYLSGKKEGEEIIIPVELKPIIYKKKIKGKDENEVTSLALEEIQRFKNYATVVFNFHVPIQGTLVNISDNKESWVIEDGLLTSYPNHLKKFFKRKDRTILFHEQGFDQVYHECTKQIDELLKQASFDSPFYHYCDWFSKGIYSINSFDIFLDFWRVTEFIIDKELINRCSKISVQLTKQLGWSKNKAEKEVKNILKKRFDSKEKRMMFILDQKKVAAELSEIKRLYRLRCKIAHGQAKKKDIPNIDANIPRIREIARDLIVQIAHKEVRCKLYISKDLRCFKPYREEIYWFNWIMMAHQGIALNKQYK